MIFLCILIAWSHEEIIFICANVSCSYDATAAKSRYYFKWFQSKFKDKEKFVVACLSPQEKLAIRKFYVLVVQQRQRNPTEKRAL